jgi:hypothetical protein
MASCMHNGNNETKIGLSHSVTITFSDINGNEIHITNSSQMIDIWIPRDINEPIVSPQYVNVTEQINIYNNSEQQLFPIGFNISALNSSFHIELSPLNNSIGYLVLLKYNMTPRFNSKFQDYDKSKIFCPSG